MHCLCSDSERCGPSTPHLGETPKVSKSPVRFPQKEEGGRQGQYSLKTLLHNFFFLACGNLVPLLRIEPVSSAMKAWSPEHRVLITGLQGNYLLHKMK